MPNGWSAKDVKAKPSLVLGASLTDSVVSLEYPVTAGGAIHHVVKVKSSAVTVGAGITAKLQTAIGSDWVDSKTAAITVAGAVYIKLLAEAAADQTFLPLLNKNRVVVTTGAGSAVTIDSVEILEDL